MRNCKKCYRDYFGVWNICAPCEDHYEAEAALEAEYLAWLESLPEAHGVGIHAV